MSEQIDRFLSALENWKENFEVKNFDTTGDDELSQIIAMQRNKDVDGLLKVWERKLDQDYFELPHPDNNTIISRAIRNFSIGENNFILMLDAENRYPWIIGQRWSFIELMITECCIYDLYKHIPTFQTFKEVPLLKDKFRGAVFGDVNYAAIVSKTTPFHFFYDKFKYLLRFNAFHSDCHLEYPFFTLSSDKDSGKEGAVSSNEKVYLHPSLVQNLLAGQDSNKAVKDLNEEMERFVYNESLKDFIKTKNDRGCLKLWYGITGQKRSWLQQIDGAENIIKKLLPHFNEIELCVDGMTAPEGNSIRNADDEAVFRQIENRLEGQCRIQSLIGQDYRHKIRVCSTVDLFIANAGTGCMVPLRFCKKPGVLHSNTKLFTFPGVYPKTVKRFDKEYVIDVLDEGKKSPRFASYHLPWQHVFNLTAEVLNQIKGTDIKPLEVPPVEEVAKHYDEQQKAQKQKLMAFTAIENRVKPTHKSPDILREVALSFEHAGDIETALKIMQKALELRPTGPFIKKKVIEYQAVIESTNQKVK